jgi:hypothetical protein
MMIIIKKKVKRTKKKRERETEHAYLSDTIIAAVIIM